jgi:hypothetical protein
MPWSDGRAYRVRKDAQLAGGEHTFSSVDIPEGVTVTVTGDVVIHVTGDTNIAGTLTGDCVRIALQGQDDITITGTVDNQCAEGGPVTATGGNAGGPGATNGSPEGSGGLGGKGGDGIPPGQGGAGGAGTNVPNGSPGPNGAPCPMAQKDIKQLVDEEIALVNEGRALLEEHAEGSCTEGIERLQSAIEICGAVLMLDPDNAEACFCLGTARHALEKDLDEAIQNLECAVEGLEDERRAQAVDILEELEERRAAPISVSMGPILCAEDWDWETGDPINPGPDFAADSVMEVWCRWELHDPGSELTVVKWIKDGELVCQHYDKLDAWSEWTGSGWTEENEYIETANGA